MRFRRRRTRGSWTAETSRLAHAAKRRRRREGPPPEYPAAIPVGQLLHRIRVESFMGHAHGFEVVIRQAPRRNQVVVETFGRSSLPHGMDWVMRHLRKRTVTRWLALR